MNKNSQTRLLYLLSLGIVIFGIITLTFISAPTTQNGKVIISPKANNLTSNGIAYTKGWQIISKTGIESRLTFWTSGTGKKVELGWIPPNNNCSGWLPMNIFNQDNNLILDDKSKAVQVKCETAKCDGKNCYHISLTDAQAVNINDYIKLGNQSFIVTYQNESKIVYDFDYGQTNITLFKNNQLVSNELFVYWNENEYKFGANDSSLAEGQLANYSYILNSTNELILQDKSYYAGENYTYYNETTYDENGTINGSLISNSSTPIYYPYPIFYNFEYQEGSEARFVYNFKDICSNNYSNCRYVLYNNKKTARIDFVSDKYIDPTAGATDVSDCLTLNTANTYYQLNQSISNETMTIDCIIISKQNITFDCDGYSIGSSKNFTGVYSNQKNTTVKNCNISMGTGASTSSFGIELVSGSNNSYVFNNTINNTYYGIYVGSGNVVVEANTVDTTYTTGTAAGPIYLIGTSSNNNTVKNNIVLSSGSAGITLTTSTYSETVFNNSIYMGGAGRGISMSTNNNNITGNYIYPLPGSTGEGISVGSNNIIEKNIIITLNSAIGVSSTNTGNIIRGNTITSTVSTDGAIDNNGGDNNIISYNTILNNGSSSAYGLWLRGTANNNTLIGNNATSIKSYGIYVNVGTENNLTDNIGISNSSSGIILLSGSNTLTSNTGTSNTSYGIYLYTSLNNTLTNNIGISNSSHGIRLEVSSNNTLINNIGISNSSYGIYVFSTSFNNTLINNTGTSNSDSGIIIGSNSNILINNTGTVMSGGNAGIYLSSSSNCILTGNNGTSFSSAYGIWLNSANHNILTSNTGTSDTGFGLLIQNSLNNTLIQNNISTSSVKSIYLSNGDGNRFYNLTAVNYVSGYQTYGIYTDTNSDNNIFQDCINISGVDGDVVLTGTSVNNTFINCSYRTSGTYESVASGSTLKRKWYYQAYVNNSVGNPISGAKINATNITGQQEFFIYTNPTGFTNVTTITDYENIGGTRNYYSLYLLNASNTTDYVFHNFNASIGNNLTDFFTFEGGGAPPADTEYPLFYSYWDNNATLIGSGVGYFNVSINSTNGTVILQINNTNITATNLSSNTYNVSYTFVTNDTYSYIWISWGNGTSHLFNVSDTRSYTVNNTDTIYPLFSSFTSVPANNSNYSQGAIYRFNATILNGNQSIGIEFNKTNYTLNNLNITADVYNFTINDLGAGTYPYYWWAYGNGTSHYFNKTVTYYYTINKTLGLMNATINNTQGNFTSYNGTETMNIYLNLTNITGYGTGKIYYNGSLWNSGNLPLYNVSNLSLGYYNITFVYDGNENYTGINYSWWVNNTIPIDTIYPIFSNYWDNNATVIGNGLGKFNVTVMDTNGTVWLDINNTNITATNLTANVYNVSYNFGTNNTYAYRWWAYGNGTSKLLNRSDERSYTVNNTEAPVCYIMNRTPADINDSSTGRLNVMINCTDVHGLNITKLGDHYPFFITRTVDAFILAPGIPNYWSNRYPNNSLGVVGALTPPYKIWRALGRNEGYWYDNLTTMNNSCEGVTPCYRILNDTFSYAIEDGEYGHFTITNTTTEYIINYTHPAVDIASFRQSVYLSYESMVKEGKKNYSITKNNYVLMKRFDAEAYRGTQNYTMNSFRNFAVTGSPTKTLRAFYCNSSYNPAGSTQVINSPNCALISSLTNTELNNIIFTDRNSSYSKGTYGIINGLFSGIKATAEFYIEYETPETASGKAYEVRYANETTNAGLGFNETKVTWTTTNGGTTWAQANFTLDVMTTSTRSANDEFMFGLYISDLNGNLYTNFSMVVDTITTTNHPISFPLVLEYNSTAKQMDIDLNNTHKGIMNIKIGVAKDPDMVDNVTHNLSLINIDGSFNYTINGSFKSPNDNDLWIDFNTSKVIDGFYRMNITAIAGDNQADIKSRTTDRNFTIDNTPPYFINIHNISIYDNTTISSYFNASDSLRFDSFAINWTTTFSINKTGYFTNISALSAGNYYINVTINDSVNNLNSTVIYINITSSVLPLDKYPTFSSNTTTPSNGSQYSPGKVYEFNITILDTNTTTGIQFNGTNYTLSNITGVYNKTFTDLSTGVYTYFFWSYGNGSSTYFNTSETYSYSIVQNNTHVINTSFYPSQSITYLTPLNATGTGCPSQLTCNLYRNDTSITSGDNYTLGAGYYNYTYNTTGNWNYSFKSVSYIVNVAKSNDSVVYLYLNNTRANITIFNNTAIWLNGTLFNVTGIVKLYNNGTLIGQNDSRIGNLTNFNATGLYNITAIFEGNENYTWNYETFYVNVTGILDIIQPYFTVIPNPISQSYPQDFNVTFTASDETAFGYYSINWTDTFSINQSGYLNNTGRLGVGNYYINVTINDSVGNVNSTIYNLNITQNTTLVLSLTGTTPINYLTASNYQGSGCPSELICNLTRNDTGIIVNPDTSILGVGYYNYTFNTSGNANYSYQSVSSILTVNKNNDNCDILFNATSPKTYPYYFLAYTNCSSEFAIYRNGTLISNNSQQDLAVGDYNFTVIRNDTENYTNIVNNKTFTISQSSSLVFLYINHTRANFTSYNGTNTLNIWLNGSLQTGTGNIQLYINGSLINNGTSPIKNQTNLSLGNYNITVKYIGNQNYSANSEIWWVNNTLPPLDTTPPTFTNLRNFTHTANTTFGETINATDSSGIETYALNDTNYFNINSTGYITNVTNLSRIEIHYLNISVNDTLGNMVSGVFWINVTIAPPILIPTGGGGGGGIGYVKVNVTDYLCNKTYHFILDYGTNVYLIDDLINQIIVDTGKREKSDNLYYYLTNWQYICSDKINQSLNPQMLCQKIYYLLIEKNYTISENDMTYLKNSLSNNNLVVSQSLLKNYIDNYNEKCYIAGYSDKLFSKQLPFLIMPEINITKCSENIGVSPFDSYIYIPLGNLGNIGCQSLELLRWFVRLENDEGNFKIIGVKMWILLFLMMVGMVVLYVSVYRRNGKEVKKST